VLDPYDVVVLPQRSEARERARAKARELLGADAAKRSRQRNRADQAAFLPVLENRFSNEHRALSQAAEIDN